MKIKPIKFSYFVLSMIGIVLFTHQLIGNNLDKKEIEITNDTLNNTSQQKILQQLGTRAISRYDDFISQQIYPKNRDLTIWFVPRPSDDDDFLSEANVIIADTHTAKIICNKIIDVNEDIDGTPYQLRAIDIDTLGSALSDDKIVFGITFMYSVASRVWPSTKYINQLFVQEKDTLESIFTYQKSYSYEETDDTKTIIYVVDETETKMYPMEHKTDGLHDFKLVTSISNRRWKKNKLTSNKSKIDTVVYRYTPLGYRKLK